MAEGRKIPFPREDNREAARQRLLDSALALFNQKGYAATSVREIVEAAGVTKPVLYYYFKNKEGIFHAIMERSIGVYSREMEKASTFRGTCRERLFHLLTSVYDLFVGHIEIPRLLLNVHLNPDQEAPAIDFDKFTRLFERSFLPVLREGVKGGELKDAPLNHLMLALAGVVNMAMQEQLNACCKKPRMGRNDLVPVLDLVFQGIAADTGKKETP